MKFFHEFLFPSTSQTRRLKYCKAFNKPPSPPLNEVRVCFSEGHPTPPKKLTPLPPHTLNCLKTIIFHRIFGHFTQNDPPLPSPHKLNSCGKPCWPCWHQHGISTFLRRKNINTHPLSICTPQTEKYK